MSQRRRRCQLSFKEALHGLAEWARHARTEPGEAAQLWYRGTVGPIARVYGPGGASVRPRRRVATRVSIVSGIEKKDDLCAIETSPARGGVRPHWGITVIPTCGAAPAPVMPQVRRTWGRAESRENPQVQRAINADSLSALSG